MVCLFAIRPAATIAIAVTVVVGGFWTGGNRRVMTINLRITGPKRTMGRHRSSGGLFA